MESKGQIALLPWLMVQREFALEHLIISYTKFPFAKSGKLLLLSTENSKVEVKVISSCHKKHFIE